MLDKQFFGDEKFADYLTKNFIPIHAYKGKELGNLLYKKYNVRATPTVLVAMADGTEIDRIIGYGPPAEKFKEKIEETYKSENSLLNITKAFEKDPNNLELIAKLAQKYQGRYDFEKMAEYTDKILELPNRAKKVKLQVSEKDVSAYEYAKLAATYNDPKNVVTFLNEFPESELKETAFSNLGRLLRAREVSEETLDIYNNLLKQYPNNPALSLPYISYCIRTKTNTDLALKLAGRIYETISEQNNGFALSEHAGLLLTKGNDKKAVKVYGDNFVQNCLNDQKMPDDSKASLLNSYSWFWAQEGKNLDSAFKAAKKSLDLSNDANTWDTLSMVYWKMDKHTEAIKAEEEALKLSGGENENFKKRIEEIRADMKKISSNNNKQ